MQATKDIMPENNDHLLAGGLVGNSEVSRLVFLLTRKSQHELSPISITKAPYLDYTM